LSLIAGLAILFPPAAAFAGGPLAGVTVEDQVPPGLLWVDTKHEDASVNRKQVAITADGEHVLTGWWVNNERVQLYRRDNMKSVEWRADISGTDWFLPLESDREGRSMVCATRGDGAERQSLLYLWDKSSPEPVHQMNAPANHLWVDAATCDDGRFFFGLAQGPAPDYTGWVICYDRESGLLRWWYEMDDQSLGLDCSADGTRLAAGNRFETVVLDTATGLPLDQVVHPGGSQTLPALSGDGTLLAVGTTSGQLALYGWEGSAYLERWVYNFPVLDDTSFVSSVDISDDGSTVAAGTLDFLSGGLYGGSCMVFDRSGPLPVFGNTEFGDQVNEIELTPDGLRVAVVSHGRLGGGAGALLAVFDRDSGRTVFSLSDQAVPGIGSAYSVALSEDGSLVAFGGKACHAREEGSGGYAALARLPTAFLAFLDTMGRETGEILVGLDIGLLLEDHGANTDPGNRETVVVRVVNTATADEEQVTLRETAEDSGKFRGTLPAVFSPSTIPVAGDGRLDCGSGDLLRAVYVDAGNPENRTRAEAHTRWRTQIVSAPGPDRENPARGRISDPFGQADLAGEIGAYGNIGFGMRVALGDVDGDGVDEIVTGPGPGPEYGPAVRVIEADGTVLSRLSFMAYGTLRYGVNVACGDVDGDGIDEIITGAGPGTMFGPHVRGWNADGTEASAVPGLSFLAYGTSRFGVNVACGDLDGDGMDEIVTGAGPGAVFGPHVRAWNHDGGPGVAPIPGISFLAYGTSRFGVNVACGDLDGDGQDEIVTGPGPGDLFSSHVRAWRPVGGGVSPVPGVSFLAYGHDYRFGAQVAAGDLDLDGVDELITAPGADPRASCRVRGFKVTGSGVLELDYCDFFAFEELVRRGGNVAAGSLR
jgi:hypothetical protein